MVADISLAGGAKATRQYLASRLVGEMEINFVPTLLGSGERLFRDLDDLSELELVRTVAAPNMTHLKFAKTIIPVCDAIAFREQFAGAERIL